VGCSLVRLSKAFSQAGLNSCSVASLSCLLSLSWFLCVGGLLVVDLRLHRVSDFVDYPFDETIIYCLQRCLRSLQLQYIRLNQ